MPSDRLCLPHPLKESEQPTQLTKLYCSGSAAAARHSRTDKTNQTRRGVPGSAACSADEWTVSLVSDAENRRRSEGTETTPVRPRLTTSRSLLLHRTRRAGVVIISAHQQDEQNSSAPVTVRLRVSCRRRSVVFVVLDARCPCGAGSQGLPQSVGGGLGVLTGEDRLQTTSGAGSKTRTCNPADSVPAAPGWGESVEMAHRTCGVSGPVVQQSCAETNETLPLRSRCRSMQAWRRHCVCCVRC